MPYKPMPFRTFQQYLKCVSWSLEKGSIDYNLYDDKGHFICSIKKRSWEKYKI